MEESQREAMYKGWAKSKTFLTPLKHVDDQKVVLTVKHEGDVHEETVYKKDCFGSADPYNIAFNRLLIKMQAVDKNIELKYEIK